MSSRPSASNSDLYVNGDPAWPVFDESYSKFEVTEKRMNSDDVICLPASEVRAVCPDLMPKPMPRPQPGCPPNFGPRYTGPTYPGGDIEESDYGGRYGISGGFYDGGRPIGGDWRGRPFRPRPPKPLKTLELLSRPDGMYHGRHVTARGLKPTRFATHTLVSPRARGGPLSVTLTRAKGNGIKDIKLGKTQLLRGVGAISTTQTTMSFNVPRGFHTNAQKASEAGWWRDPLNQSSSISLKQAIAGKTAVYTKTRAAFVRRPGEMVRGRRVINRTRVSDIVMEKRLKMLGANSFSYGVSVTYPRTHKFVTTRTSVFKSLSPRAMSRVTALNKAGRWVAVRLSGRRRYLSVVNYQAIALSTADGKKSIGVSLHDFPKARAGNWFKPVTQYTARMTPVGVNWSLVQQMGRRGAVVRGWQRQGRRGRRVRRTRVLPFGKFSYGMTWSAGTMAQVQAALRKAAATKGRQADTNIVDTPQQTKKVCTPKKNLNKYCKGLKCKVNDKRGACFKCLDCKVEMVLPKPPKTKEMKKNKKCVAVNSPECAGCTLNDPLPECKGCTVCK
jgi:hypothetical protein